MNPERWRQIDEILGEALRRDAALRGRFLAEVCAGDVAPELVEALRNKAPLPFE